MSNTAEVYDSTFGTKSFSIIYVGECVYCSSVEQTNDHHCKGSDIIVTQMRNKLDDKAEAKGHPPNQWCKHDNVTARRKLYKKNK